MFDPVKLDQMRQSRDMAFAQAIQHVKLFLRTVMHSDRGLANMHMSLAQTAWKEGFWLEDLLILIQEGEDPCNPEPFTL